MPLDAYFKQGINTFSRVSSGIVTGKILQLSVFKTMGVLDGGALLVMVGFGVSGWNEHNKCVDQMLDDPSFGKGTVEQKAARLDSCMVK